MSRFEYVSEGLRGEMSDFSFSANGCIAFWGGAELKRKARGTIILNSHASEGFGTRLASRGTLVEILHQIHLR